MKTFADVIDVFDAGNLYVICYNEYEDVLFEGFLSDTPYWVAKLPLDIEGCKEMGTSPIDYRSSLGSKYDEKPGLVISLID